MLIRERNGGKGAALLDGLIAARREGFTHALTMDAVVLADQHLQAWVAAGHGAELFGTAIGAAIDDDPYRVPLRARGMHRFQGFIARVVTRDQHQVRLRGLHTSGRPHSSSDAADAARAAHIGSINRR